VKHWSAWFERVCSDATDERALCARGTRSKRTIVTTVLRVIKRVACLSIVAARCRGRSAHLLDVLIHDGPVAQRLRRRKVGVRARWIRLLGVQGC
jgi:hypothetical protein